jgi:hypothetical protein
MKDIDLVYGYLVYIVCGYLVYFVPFWYGAKSYNSGTKDCLKLLIKALFTLTLVFIYA